MSNEKETKRPLDAEKLSGSQMEGIAGGADDAASGVDGISGIRVDPPADELGHPAICVRVAGGTDQGCYAAHGTVTG